MNVTGPRVSWLTSTWRSSLCNWHRTLLVHCNSIFETAFWRYLQKHRGQHFSGVTCCESAIGGCVAFGFGDGGSELAPQVESTHSLRVPEARGDRRQGIHGGCSKTLGTTWLLPTKFSFQNLWTTNKSLAATLGGRKIHTHAEDSSNLI